MPRRSQALISTAREVASAKPPTAGRVCAEFRIAGTPNLVLRVTATGHRFWTYVLKRPKTGRWQKYNIGPYPAIGLARARDEAIRLRRSVIDGIDPFDLRAVGRDVPSLKKLGETFIARYAKPKKRSWAEDARKLEADVYPELGDARADLITKPDFVRLLDAIHDRGAPVAANRTLSVIRKLFNWAIAEGYLETNPASGIPLRAKEHARRRVLTEPELRTFWKALDGPGFEDVTADALKLQLLLGARIREVTGMTRAELDLECKVPVWTLPAARAKGARDVSRPRSDLALAIIRRRLAATPKSQFVFASPFDHTQPITPRAPGRALQRAGQEGLILPQPEQDRVAEDRRLAAAERNLLWSEVGFVPHDLRRTCRTFWAKLGISETVAKKLLGHVPPKADVTASVYDQYTYIPEMLNALRRWESHLLAIGDRPPSRLEVAA